MDQLQDQLKQLSGGLAVVLTVAIGLMLFFKGQILKFLEDLPTAGKLREQLVIEKTKLADSKELVANRDAKIAELAVANAELAARKEQQEANVAQKDQEIARLEGVIEALERRVHGPEIPAELDEIEVKILEVLSVSGPLDFDTIVLAIGAGKPILLHRMERLGRGGFILKGKHPSMVGSIARYSLAYQGREWLHLKGLLG